MEDVMVFGQGKYYRSNIENINKLFNVYAVIDNRICTNEKKRMYNPKDIKQLPVVPILIMVSSIVEVKKIIRQLSELCFTGAILIGLNYFKMSDGDAERIARGKIVVCGEKLVYISTMTGNITVEDNGDLKKIGFLFARKKYPIPTGLLDICPNPLNHDFAYSRGTPIMRYYIDHFLELNQKYICGNVMEIGDNQYTLKYGNSRVRKSLILDVHDGDGKIQGDLQSGEGIQEEMVDCFILTQVLDFIYDMKSAAANIVRALTKKGTALITVSGISQISRYDMDRWGHYWNFTDKTIKKVFSGIVGENNVKVQVFGNVKVAMLKLYGACAEELSPEDLDYVDEDYQVMIAAVVKKN